MTDDTAVIDGSAEEIDATPDTPIDEARRGEPTPGAALAVRAGATNEVLMPLDAQRVVEGMKAYQRLLQDLLDPTDWQLTNEWEDDPQNPGQKRKKRFPKKSAYRKIARAFNLSFEVVSRSIDRGPDGAPLSAETVMRAVAPNGQYGDGDGYCSISEFTGRRAGDSKLENSMRATATTRAKNRAIADLVGMGEVSAEEVVAAGAPVGAPVAELPHWVADADDELLAKTRRALGYLLADDPQTGDRVAEVLRRVERDRGGTGLPAIAARALLQAAAVHHAAVQQHGAEPTAETGARDDDAQAGAPAATDAPADPPQDEPSGLDAAVARGQRRAEAQAGAQQSLGGDQ